jgi:hypothetical protein
MLLHDICDCNSGVWYVLQGKNLDGEVCTLFHSNEDNSADLFVLTNATTATVMSRKDYLKLSHDRFHPRPPPDMLLTELPYFTLLYLLHFRPRN